MNIQQTFNCDYSSISQALQIKQSQTLVLIALISTLIKTRKGILAQPK